MWWKSWKKLNDMLRKIRIIVAWVVVIGALLLVADISGGLHRWLTWISHVQLVPAILHGMVGLIVFVGLLTSLFGRVYCSVLCPLGVAQDGAMYVAGKKKFGFRRVCNVSRYGVLAAFVVLVVAGLTWTASLIEPWGIFGRIASTVFAPVYKLGNNGLAWAAERADGYAFYSVDVMVKSWLALGVAVLTAVVIWVMAVRRGRLWCNSICPAGTTLGLLSRSSVFGVRIDKAKCTSCGVCEKKCKGECIDSKAGTVDRSRCVACFDCLEGCKFGAISYSTAKKGCGCGCGSKTDGGAGAKDPARRTFLAVGALFVAAAAKAQGPTPLVNVDGGLADIVAKKRPVRKVAIVPPGAEGAKNMSSKCVACGLCVSACPNNVLVPSTRLATLMQPEMTFEKGYCRPECVECGVVCPAGAIKRIDTAEKTAISVGQAVWVADNCVVNRDDLACTACERHCPTKAITLVPRDPSDPKSLKIPSIDPTKCIGCGACENLCAARPYSAIYVEGNQTHHEV